MDGTNDSIVEICRVEKLPGNKRLMLRQFSQKTKRARKKDKTTLKSFVAVPDSMGTEVANECGEMEGEKRKRKTRAGGQGVVCLFVRWMFLLVCGCWFEGVMGLEVLPNGDGSGGTPGTGLRKVVHDWIAGTGNVQTKYGHIRDWDVSHITSFAYVFYNMNTGNPHISKFNEQRQKQFIEEMNKQINEIKSISTIQKEHRRRTAEKERKHKEIQARNEREKKKGRFIVLKEESIRYKKTWKSIGIGLLLTLPIHVLYFLFPERVDSHDLNEFSIINIFAWIWIIAIDTACCFYPLFLGQVLAYDKEELEKLDRELNPKSESKKDWDKEPQVMLVGESKERRRFGYRLTSSLKTNHARPISIKIIQEGFKLEYEINSISDAQSGKLKQLMKDRIIGALTLGVRGKHTAHIEIDGDAYFLFVTFKVWSFKHGVKRLSLARVNGDEEIIADLDT